ncbi:MAG: hypothetical protein QM785_12410 [Pyrinomonadaceae bacterium]
MLFRPSFCANCGEKVERPEWFPWTSRRFCTVCEIEYKGYELIPKIVIIGSLLIGTFGIGAYLKSGTPDSELQALRQPKKLVEQTAPLGKPPVSSIAANVPQPVAPVSVQPEHGPNSSTIGTRPLLQQSRPKIEIDEPVNYCGAETKKGTPCSRRVKGSTRCFQHIGMPSMIAAQKPDIRSQK